MISEAESNRQWIGSASGMMNSELNRPLADLGLFRPLVSVVLYAYNEESYVRQAVSSLLGQDYAPLEVILSDDGSTDGTYEAMRALAASYPGPHRVLLNRNQCNLGIGAQLNAALKMSSGELIVLANADDVSKRDRVSKLVAVWVQNGRKAVLLSSNAEIIDSSGGSTGKQLQFSPKPQTLDVGMRERFSGPGAVVLALRRDVFTAFGPLPDDLILEDSVLRMRAAALARSAFIHLDEPLVSYRVHKDNISQAYAVGEFGEWRERHRAKAVWQSTEGAKAYLCMLRDLRSVPEAALPHDERVRAYWAGLEKLLETSMKADFYSRERAFGYAEKAKMLLRLAMVMGKIWLKVLFPRIELRNDRWHYRKVQREARG